MISVDPSFPLWHKQDDIQRLVSASGKSGSPSRTNGMIDTPNVGIEDQNMCYQLIVKNKVSVGFNWIFPLYH